MTSKATLLSLGISILVLAGCATGKLEAQWSDAQFAGQPTGDAKVLVVCEAVEQTVIRICQDQLVAQLHLIGVTPVLSDVLANSPQTSAADRLAMARSLGAQSVMVSSLNPVTTPNNYGPSMGFGFGTGGYHSGAAFGMTFPIGNNAQTSATSYVSDTTLTNVASGKLMWSGKASTMALEVPDQLASLAKVSVESARKAGML
jgi:hypothetical protein